MPVPAPRDVRLAPGRVLQLDVHRLSAVSGADGARRLLRARVRRARWGPLLQTLFIAVRGAAAHRAAGWRDWPLRRLRVFISKHFYRNKYDYRIEWLRFIQTLVDRATSWTCGAPRSARWRRSSTARAACCSCSTSRKRALLPAGGLADERVRGRSTSARSSADDDLPQFPRANANGSSTCTSTARRRTVRQHGVAGLAGPARGPGASSRRCW